MTLGAPAVHHSRFTHGGLTRIKANIIETNKRLCYLQDKLQDVLILNSDIDDALDHLSQIIESPSTNIEYPVLKLSLQRVVKAVNLIECKTPAVYKLISMSLKITVECILFHLAF